MTEKNPRSYHITEVNIEVKTNRFRWILNHLDQSKYRLNAQIRYDSRISDKVAKLNEHLLLSRHKMNSTNTYTS